MFVTKEHIKTNTTVYTFIDFFYALMIFLFMDDNGSRLGVCGANQGTSAQI
jgi:hypothetical protein